MLRIQASGKAVAAAQASARAFGQSVKKKRDEGVKEGTGFEDAKRQAKH